MQKQPKYYTPQESYVRIAAYCAYQERTQQDVREKLQSYGLDDDDVEELIVRMIQEKFVNEERFAKAYAGGRFRQKKWGRIKIKMALKAQGLSPYCVQQGMNVIDPDEYWQNLLHLAEKKNAVEKESNPLLRKQKITRFLMGKGYEQDLVWEAIETVNGIKR